MEGKAKKIFLSYLALAVVALSALFAIGEMFRVHKQSSAASGIISVTEYYTPGGNPWGTTFDSNGRVWVAMPGCDLAPSCPSDTPPGKLGLFNPVSRSWVTIVSLPQGYGQPLFVAVDQNGNVWFTMPVTNAIGKYDPSTTNVSQWAVPTASSGPWDIAIDTKGTIWFTEHYGNKIGSYNPGTNSFSEIATPAINSNPYGITIDKSDNIWFTENVDSVAQIGKYSTQGVLSEYKIRSTPTGGTGLTPHKITIDENGNVWWSEGWVHAIGMLNVAAAQPGTNNGVTEYSYTPSCSSCGSHTSGISAGKQGLIWLDDSLQDTFGSFPIGGGTFSFTKTGGHPHDGLNVDAQNNIWFDQEFANKLVVAVPSSGSTTPTPIPTPTLGSPTLTPVPGAILGKDTFQRANQSLWGNASDGQIWSGDANSQSVFSIANNTGRLSNGSGVYSAVLGPSIANSEVIFSGSMSSFNNANMGAVLRWTDNNNWYKAYIDGMTLVLQSKVGGSYTTLATTSFVATAATAYTIRFSIVGSGLSGKVWPTASAEPAAWTVIATNSALQSGFAGLRIQTASAGTVTIHSFQANVPGESSSPTPTATATSTATAPATATGTSTPGATTTSTPTPTATPPAGGTLGQDTFQRANQSLWGSASDGQNWGSDANINNVFSISNNTGRISNAGSISYSAVLGATASNAEVNTSGSISSFSNSNFGPVLRWTDGNNWYKAFIDGSSLTIQKKVNGSTTVIKSVPFAAVAGMSYTIHFRISGSTLMANVWAASGIEPDGWMATVTDSSLTSGYCGLRVLTQSGTITITSFVANSL